MYILEIQQIVWAVAMFSKLCFGLKKNKINLFVCVSWFCYMGNAFKETKTGFGLKLERRGEWKLEDRANRPDADAPNVNALLRKQLAIYVVGRLRLSRLQTIDIVCRATTYWW